MRAAAADGVVPAVVVEDRPSHPVLAAVRRLTFRAPERRELEVDGEQRGGVAGFQRRVHGAALAGLERHPQAPREALALAALVAPDPRRPRDAVAQAAGELRPRRATASAASTSSAISPNSRLQPLLTATSCIGPVGAKTTPIWCAGSAAPDSSAALSWSTSRSACSVSHHDEYMKSLSGRATYSRARSSAAARRARGGRLSGPAAATPRTAAPRERAPWPPRPRGPSAARSSRARRAAAPTPR